uniref:Uncharacterized protein n=1 Tax=viral metagenome TaxID=1070528 RepID=A0A6C0CCD4_9ZZZZ
MELAHEDLYRKHDQLANLKRQTYEQIYKRCANTIKYTADIGELFCIFKIPNFLFGSDYPIINIPSCARYITEKLKKISKQMKTTFVEPDILIIDWRRDVDV